jgi:hypothetical protein
MAMVAVNAGRRLGLIRGREVERRIAIASSMLWDRMCPGGGWNAGNSVVYGVPLAPNMEATSIALLALQGNLHGPEADRSLLWLLGADCGSAYSMAWKVLALQAHLKSRPDIATILETSRVKLSKLVEDRHQIADTCALALSVLALDSRRNPFGIEAKAAR